MGNPAQAGIPMRVTSRVVGMRIQVTAVERQSGALSEAHKQEAIAAIEEDGFVILGGAVDSAVLDALKPKLDEDTAELLRRGKWGGAGAVRGHLQQSMPRDAKYIFPEIVINPFIIGVTSAILGKGVHNHFYNGNTNMPGSEQQPLHRDMGHLWPGLIHPTTSLVINVSPVDVDEGNGATQIWPGTHRIVDEPATEEQRRAVRPPARAITSKGDAVLRDIRLWHRGMPNHGAAGRHMIGMVHSAWFYLTNVEVPVMADAVHSFEHDVLTTPTRIVDDDYDYLSEFVKP